METWATFSIIDHRKPIYRQALALFDRIVVPLPPKPIGDQTQEELDQLEAVDYLREAQAAEPSFCRDLACAMPLEPAPIGEGAFCVSTKGIILSIVWVGQAVFARKR
jgi:hypothetical protein